MISRFSSPNRTRYLSCTFGWRQEDGLQGLLHVVKHRLDALEDLVAEVVRPLPQLVGDGLDPAVQLGVRHLHLVAELSKKRGDFEYKTGQVTAVSWDLTIFAYLIEHVII